MDLSIIIVSWNTKDKLKENLKALYKGEGNFSFEIFVVDNASSDRSADMIRSNFPDVVLIENKENYGFAKAKEKKGAEGTATRHEETIEIRAVLG